MVNRFSARWAIVRVTALCLTAGLLVAPAMGQSFYGSLIGTVKDAQGAVIPGATIVVVNTGTNERHEGVSSGDGSYQFVNLIPGVYRLEVQLQGFQRYVRDGIQVSVQSAPRIDATLQLGNIAETIQVTGAAPLLQAQDASVGSVVGSRAGQER